MHITDWERFHNQLIKRARELCPDYPGIKGLDDPFELLWAITGSLEGCRLANEDLHKLLSVLQDKLKLTDEQILRILEQIQKDEGIELDRKGIEQSSLSTMY